MTSLVAAGYFNTAITNQNAKDAQDGMLAVIRELLGGTIESELTIATGSVTPTAAIHNIDTESDAASDDLTNIAQTNHPDGRLLMVRATNASRTVVLKHNSGGAGEIILVDNVDFSLDDTDKWCLLKRTGSLWEEVCRFYGNDMAGLRTFMGLGTAAVVNTGTGDTNVPTGTNLKGTARAFTAPQRHQVTDTQTGQSGALTFDLTSYIDFDYTVNGNFSFANPTLSAAAVGQRGSIRITQDGTGSRLLTALGSYFKRVGATGAPTMSTAAAAIDRFDYHVISTTRVEYSFGAVE